MSTGSSSSSATGAALVLFSGGQDSTVCLAWALRHYARVETIGFDYGQNHSVELACRTALLEKLRAEFPALAAALGEDHCVDLRGYGALAESSLTRPRAIRMREDGLPDTFVPGRNVMFLTAAAALGYRRGLPVLVGGMCETDYSGYPDCRRDTLDALQKALSLGMGMDFEILTPLMHIDKAATWALAFELGGMALVDLIVEDTHTCYRGVRDQTHDWGKGCGTCPACVLRARGWQVWKKGA